MFFNIVGAILGAVIWVAFAILLVLQEDGVTFSFLEISNHFTQGYVPLIMALMIIGDIVVDSYVVGNPDGLVRKKPKLIAGFVLVGGLLFATAIIVADMCRDEYPDAMISATGFAIFLLFLLRCLSYVKLKKAVPITTLVQ